MKRYLNTCEKLTDVLVVDNPIQIASGMNIDFLIDNSSVFYPDFEPCLPGFVIEPGATLNIKSDLTFNLDARILVKVGGRLNVRGVALTGCDDIWQGIDVLGNASLSQLPTTNQGRVSLYEGSTIEDAVRPLRVGGGGIVLADATLFNNCGTSTFNQYKHLNHSRFTDCQFLNEAYTTFPFTANVKLTTVRGVLFDGCTFYSDPAIHDAAHPIAIDALSSNFGVWGGSSFEGYYKGIYAGALNGATDRGFSVTGCTFTSNFIGVEDWNMDNAIIRNNIFENIGTNTVTGISSKESPVGILLRNCTRYQVTDNDMTGATAVKKSIGVLAHDTGGDNNTIRRNTYDNLNMANQAELVNKGVGFVNGLQYWCNTNTDNMFDFMVFGTICQEQGAALGSKLATKNTFSQINVNAGDFNNLGGGLINYYYRTLPLETPEEYANINPDDVSNPVPCTDNIGDAETDGGLSGPKEDTLVNLFNNAKSQYQAKLIQYNNTPHDSLLPQIAAEKHTMHRTADRILRSELADTTSIDLPKIRTWLRKKDSKESEYAIVESWVLLDSFEMAWEVLDSVTERYRLSGNDSLQHVFYEDWLELRDTFFNREKDLYDLDSADVELVKDIAEEAIGIVAAQTQALLNHAYDYDYYVVPDTIVESTEIMAPPMGYVANFQQLADGQVTAFPNPTKGEVNFRYRLVTDAEVAWLTVQDVNGRLVARLLLHGTEGTLRWEIEGQPSGIYYYKAQQPGGFDMPRKLVIIK